MARMSRRLSVRLRAAALLPAGVLAVHELRYRLAFGGHASEELAHEGHGYLGLLTPLVGVLLALAAGLFLARVLHTARRGRGAAGDTPRPAPLWAVALALAAVLLAVYSAQELLEGILCTGHPPGFTGVFGDGGWWAVPAAAAVGAVLALLLRGAEAVIGLAAARARGRRLRHAERVRPPRGALALPLPRLAVLASGAAGRAPPRALPAR